MCQVYFVSWADPISLSTASGSQVLVVLFFSAAHNLYRFVSPAEIGCSGFPFITEIGTRPSLPQCSLSAILTWNRNSNFGHDEKSFVGFILFLFWIISLTKAKTLTCDCGNTLPHPHTTWTVILAQAYTIHGLSAQA